MGVIFRKQTGLAAGSISGCAREQPIVALSANGSIRPNSDTQGSRLERLFMPPLPPLPMVDKPAQLVESRHSSSLSEVGLESHNACQ